MPRNAKGLGRTGRKHKKKAAGGPKAQSKISSGEGGPPSSPVPQETATAIDKVAAQSSPAPSVEDDVAGPIQFIGLHGYTPNPHPRYSDPSCTTRSAIEAPTRVPKEMRCGTLTCRRA